MVPGELCPEQVPMTAGTGGDQGYGAVESERERSPRVRGHGAAWTRCAKQVGVVYTVPVT